MEIERIRLPKIEMDKLKNFQFVHRSCPTRIRTSTNRTKICRTTIILSGKLAPDLAGTAICLAFAKGVQK